MGTLWGFLDPAEHAHMLLDAGRVDAFARAIAQVVRPGDVVLDIGTGSGVLAMLAARAGARRVFAVERSAVAELARAHVEENGLGGVIEVMRADLTEIDALPEPPRVVVGEQLGTFAPAEAQHRLYAAARRLAAPDAVLIPARYRLVFGAIEARDLRDDVAYLGRVHGLSFGALSGRLGARPAFLNAAADELLGPEVDGAWIASDAPPPTSAQARLPIARDGELGAITCAFTAELAPGVTLSTAVAAPRTCWAQTMFPVAPPLAVRAGDTIDVEIVPRVVTNSATWAWTVARGADVRAVDGFDAMLGDHANLLAAMKARPQPTGVVPTPPALRGWAAALGLTLGDTVDVGELARRAHAALPARYASVEEARQDVLALLAAAGRVT